MGPYFPLQDEEVQVTATIKEVGILTDLATPLCTVTSRPDFDITMKGNQVDNCHPSHALFNSLPGDKILALSKLGANLRQEFNSLTKRTKIVLLGSKTFVDDCLNTADMLFSVKRSKCNLKRRKCCVVAFCLLPTVLSKALIFLTGWLRDGILFHRVSR